MKAFLITMENTKSFIGVSSEMSEAVETAESKLNCSVSSVVALGEVGFIILDEEEEVKGETLQ